MVLAGLWNRVKTAATLARWREGPGAAALIERLTETHAATKREHVAKDWTPSPSLTEIRQAATAEVTELHPKSKTA